MKFHPSWSLAIVMAVPVTVLAGDPPADKPAAHSPMQHQHPDKPDKHGKKRDHASSPHVMYDAAKLKWGEAPPAFERGASAVILSGDPGKSGPFVLRIKAPAGYKIAMHWHPTDEQVTILEGDVTVKMGGKAAGAHEHTFAAGGYLLLPAKMHHSASTKNGMTLQVAGMGPFELNYIDSTDDPRKRAAK